MVRVARRPRPSPDINYHLDYQFRSWKSIPEYVAWWPEMDHVEKEVFHLEWMGITESRLLRLHEWAEQGLLTSTQRTRYETLLRLVAEHRPVVARLLAE